MRDSPLRNRIEDLEEEQKKEARYRTYKSALITLTLSYLGYHFFGYLIPDFNLSAIWLITNDITASVMQYWYVIAWGIGLALVVDISRSDRKVVSNVLTGTIAGVWEEIGYRGMFIFAGIVSIIILNVFFKWALLILLIFAVVVMVVVSWSLWLLWVSPYRYLIRSYTVILEATHSIGSMRTLCSTSGIIFLLAF